MKLMPYQENLQTVERMITTLNELGRKIDNFPNWREDLSCVGQCYSIYSRHPGYHYSIAVICIALATIPVVLRSTCIAVKIITKL